ncbi:MAG: enoyl-CoA hydratase-related protein [Ilumatobacteraceae bacterium]
MSSRATNDPETTVERGVAVTPDVERHLGGGRSVVARTLLLDLDVLTRLAESIEALAADDTRGRAVLRGRNFCAGADFSGTRLGPPGGRLISTTSRIRLFEQPLLIVVAVQGAAIGAGSVSRQGPTSGVATPSSQFAANFAMLGFHQGFGLSALPLVVGHQAAIDRCTPGVASTMTARRIGLQTTYGRGTAILADRCGRRDRRWLHRSPGGRSGQTMRGRLADEAPCGDGPRTPEQERLQRTADFAEGIAAMGERRTPRFLGR